MAYETVIVIAWQRGREEGHAEGFEEGRQKAESDQLAATLQLLDDKTIDLSAAKKLCPQYDWDAHKGPAAS